LGHKPRSALSVTQLFEIMFPAFVAMVCFTSRTRPPFTQFWDIRIHFWGILNRAVVALADALE
jgi:hypothetical protein